MDINVVLVGVVGLYDFGMVVDDVGGGEIWIFDVFYQVVWCQVVVVDQCQVVVDYFVYVVGWDIGGYVYGDVGGVVD